MFSTNRIDLHLPRSWNACTPTELEQIARIITTRTMQADRYHPFNMDDAKVELFFAFAGIEPITPANPRTKIEQQYITCRFIKPKWYNLIGKMRFHRSKKHLPFDLYIWQINAFIQENLSWLDGNSTLTLFPYQRLTRRKPWFLHSKRFAGPDALMQDFTWQRYRFAQDYMDFYIQQQNELIRMQKNSAHFSDNDFAKKYKDVDLARAMFLATIFNARIRTIDNETQKYRSTYTYQSNQHSDNARYFRNFDETQWQVILFWWSGMMNYLQNKFPHCFKKTKTKEKNGKQMNPLEIYTRTTATMEKYIGIDEDRVNRESFQVILQHLEDMAKENEETERIRRNSKRK